MTDERMWPLEPDDGASAMRRALVRLIAGGIEQDLGGGGDNDPYRWQHAERLLARYEAEVQAVRDEGHSLDEEWP